MRVGVPYVLGHGVNLVLLCSIVGDYIEVSGCTGSAVQSMMEYT